MKAFIPLIAQELGITDAGLLEQDVRLHQLLHHFTQESGIKDHLVFKGGTCLIKCHLYYPRFSVDLDFTWRGPPEWLDAASSTVRTATRTARNTWRESVAEAADRLDYNFDPQAIIWGSSSRMATAQLGYTDLHERPRTIKVQVNFVEPLAFPTSQLLAQSLLSRKEPKAVRLLDDPTLELYRKAFPVTCYDAREIAAEKARAILTRKAPKGRDILDLYLLDRELDIHLHDVMDAAKKKLDFATNLGEKYQLNLNEAPQRLRILAQQDIQPLLLRPIDQDDFEAYRNQTLQDVKSLLP